MAAPTHHHEPPHHESEAQRRSFRLTMVLMLVLILVAAAALGLVLVLRDDNGGSSTNTTASSQPATPTTPEGFARALYEAWKTGDRNAAATVASPDAVNQIFQLAYQPIATNAGPQDPYQFRDCQGAAGSTYCTWVGQASSQIIEQVRNETGGLPILVVQVQRQGG